MINKHVFSLSEMFECIRTDLPEISRKLFQTALIYTDDIMEDNIRHLKPLYPVDIHTIRIHFEAGVRQWIG